MGRQANQIGEFPLSGEEFRRQLQLTFGASWRSAFSNGTGYSRTQLHRYATGRDRVPQRVAIMLELIAIIRAYELPLPSPFTPD